MTRSQGQARGRLRGRAAATGAVVDWQRAGLRRPTSYGEAFADVYDDWYADVSDVDATGRRAWPRWPAPGRCSSSASAPAGWPCRWPRPGVEVHGIDASAGDARRGCGPSPAATRVDVRRRRHGRPDLPAGPFPLVFAAVQHVLQPRRRAGAQAGVLPRRGRRASSPGGRFVVEAFVPDDPPRSGVVGRRARRSTADRVVLVGRPLRRRRAERPTVSSSS